jgi:hypothetical protein
MTKGQRAMAVAMIYPEPQKRGPKPKGGSLSQARTVLQTLLIDERGP